MRMDTGMFPSVLWILIRSILKFLGLPDPVRICHYLSDPDVDPSNIKQEKVEKPGFLLFVTCLWLLL
jgi:hypothetical protein